MSKRRTYLHNAALLTGSGLVLRALGMGFRVVLAAYLGGAIVTHLQHQQPVVVAGAVQTLLWITAFIRFPELKRRLLTANN